MDPLPRVLVVEDFASDAELAIRFGAEGGCRLDVEVTEEAVLNDTESSIRTLESLRREGVHVAIDDFGTGYSSLARLSQLPVDTLKIDASFTRRLSTDAASRAVISTIIGLARRLDLGTIAEGVETTQQLQILQSLGCLEFQGYLHGRPQTADEFESRLRSQEHAAGQQESRILSGYA